MEFCAHVWAEYCGSEHYHNNGKHSISDSTFIFGLVLPVRLMSFK